MRFKSNSRGQNVMKKKQDPYKINQNTNQMENEKVDWKHFNRQSSTKKKRDLQEAADKFRQANTTRVHSRKSNEF